MPRIPSHCGLLALVVTCGVLAGHALAQPATAPASTRPTAGTRAATQPSPRSTETPPAATAHAPAPAAPATAPAVPAPSLVYLVGMADEPREWQPGTPRPARFWPSFDSATMAWFAAIVILALSIRPRKFASVRTLDAVVLALTCLLMLYRSDVATIWAGKTAQWWAYLGLTLAIGYWLVRGFALLSQARAVPLAGRLPAGPTLVLFLAGLALCLHQIAVGPLSESSRDGIVGGLYVLENGQLPYGDDPLAARHSPVIALLHAGACRLTPPALPDPGSAQMIPMTWSGRSEWADKSWGDDAEVTAARLVNGVLFLMLLAGVLVVGQRLYSAECGLEIAALICVFPGTLESLNDPAVLAPAALIAISTALTLLPRFGGLLGTFAFVFAGLAWPWAWLGVPIALAYAFRHGLQALGGIIGLVAGVALVAVGVSGLVQPALPRPLGALRVASQPAPYSAYLDDAQRLVIERRAAQAEASEDRAVTGFLWRALLAADIAAVGMPEADDATLPTSLPADLSSQKVLFRELAVRQDALPRMQEEYRRAVASLSKPAQFAVRLRTAVEAVWLPPTPRETVSPTPWSLWSKGEDEAASRWITIRRVAKVVAVLLSLAAGLALFLNPRPRPRQLAGALLATVAAVMLAASHGAAAHLLLLAPAALMAWAAYDPEAATPYHHTHREPQFASEAQAPNAT